MNGKPWHALLLVFTALLVSSLNAAENSVFNLLVGPGVPVAPQEKVMLPPPTLPDGLDGANQRKQVESVVEGRYTWDDFTRRSVVAPFVLKISDDKALEQRIGRRVDLWFVAFGDLKSLASDEFLTRQIGITSADSDPANGSRVKLLSGADLAKRGLAAAKAVEVPQFVAAESTILDRLRLSVTTRNIKTTTDRSICVASILDERFTNDEEFPNAWHPISRDNTGRRQIGEQQPYVGMGSYVKATRLIEPDGALFIEYHLAFAEPKGWFQGTNLLRSKLPIVVQDAVRKFRRSLEKE